MKETFPMNKIPQAIESFLKSTCDTLAAGPSTDFGSKMAQIQEACNTMLTVVIPSIIQGMDEAVAQDPLRRKDWKTVRKDKRGLVTVFGIMRIQRRYYQHKKTGERAYLLDGHLGIPAHAKVSGEVRQKAVELAAQGSYAVSAHAASACSISRMSVCNYVGHLDSFPPLEAQGKRRLVSRLYVEADEDHVSLQNGKTVLVKLVYVHEGVKEQGGRRVLVNPRYLTWPLGGSPDELWEKVAGYIEEQYVPEALEEVFLSGDAAPWIKAGEEWLYPCVPILDGFHAMKALRRLCGARQDKITAFIRQVQRDERHHAEALCKEIMEETSESGRQTKLSQANYLLNNWPRLRNRYYPGAQGCSAEGHISHILSDRLSSRPLGWSKRNVMNIAQLRIMNANGQSISYENLSGSQSQPDTVKVDTKAAALINTSHFKKLIKQSTQVGLKAASRNLPVLTCGATTQLYQALYGLSLGHAAC
jgi:hypothetical protein